jgi:hypothetical protein
LSARLLVPRSLLEQIQANSPPRPEQDKTISEKKNAFSRSWRFSLQTRQQRQHADQSGWDKHYDLRLGLRKPDDERHATSRRRVGHLQVRSVRKKNLHYDSFGKLTASTGSLVNPFQYTARESDRRTKPSATISSLPMPSLFGARYSTLAVLRRLKPRQIFQHASKLV